MISINLGDGSHIAMLAQQIANKAQLLAGDPHRMSPFAQKTVEVGHRFAGGKPDDVTVVVCTVIDSHQAAATPTGAGLDASA